MGKPAQRGLNAANDHRHITIGLFQSGCINNSSPVGAGTMPVAGCIGIIVAQFAGRGVMGHHRVHCSCRYGKTEPGTSKYHECVLCPPVRLSGDSDPETVLLKPAGQERYTKGRVINVGITADEDYIQFIPAAFRGIFSSCGYKRHGTHSRQPFVHPGRMLSQVEIYPVHPNSLATG